MAHQIYVTEAIVLGSWPRTESSRLLNLLTADLGLILANAQGVRELKSKLRCHLQNFSIARLSLVRGREFWRIVGAEPVDLPRLAGGRVERRRYLVSQLAGLILRLVQGEEPNLDLYEEVKESFSFLDREDLSADELDRFELVAVLRLVHELGYAERHGPLLPFTESPIYDRRLLEMVRPVRPLIISTVNQALKHSHL